MIKIRLNVIEVFFYDFWLMCISKILFLLYLCFFSGTLISCIYNRIGLIIDVHGIDKVTWIIEVDWIYYELMKLKCGFEWTRAWCISYFVGLFWSGAMFMIYLEELLPYSLFIDKQGATEMSCLQFTIMLH